MHLREQKIRVIQHFCVHPRDLREQKICAISFCVHLRDLREQEIRVTNTSACIREICGSKNLRDQLLRTSAGEFLREFYIFAPLTETS